MSFARSATHSIHEIASGILHHHKSRSDEPCSEEKHQEEKDFVAHYAEQHEILAPEEVQQDPRNKDLGRSSRGLNVHDFNLIRTLGTGMRSLLYRQCGVSGGAMLTRNRDLREGMACEPGETSRGGQRQSICAEGTAES